MSTCSIPVQCQLFLLYAQSNTQDSSGCISQQHNQLNAPSSYNSLPFLLISSSLQYRTAPIFLFALSWFLSISFMLPVSLFLSHTQWRLRHDAWLCLFWPLHQLTHLWALSFWMSERGVHSCHSVQACSHTAKTLTSPLLPQSVWARESEQEAASHETRRWIK